MTIQSLSRRWFERPQYRPKLPTQDSESWFPLARDELMARELSAEDCARRTAIGVPDRQGLIAAFDSTYEDWRLPRSPEATAAIERLALDDTLCVVTGQQPGFLGGPLYVLYKALTAIAVSRWVEKNRGQACVPVFWVAGEDHDIDEVRTARFPGGEAATFSLPHPEGRAPLSELAIDPPSEAVIKEFLSLVNRQPHAELVEDLAGQYHGRNVASGFAALVAKLLGHYGLVFIDPEKLRPLAKPLIQRCIEEPLELIERIELGSQELAASGLKPFVTSRLPLFLLRDGARDHLSPAANGLSIDGGGPGFDRQELLELLEREPASFSPGALLRPLVQDFLLPSITTVGGPAEVGYFAQMGPLSEWLGIDKPRILLRFQATVLAAEGGRAWSEMGLDTGLLATALGPEDLIPVDKTNAELEELRIIRQRLGSLGAGLEAENPGSRSLGRGLRTARESLQRLEGRLRRLHAQGDPAAWKKASLVWNQVLPDGKLQERYWGYLHLIAQYGTGWIEETLDEICKDPFSLAHRLIEIETR